MRSYTKPSDEELRRIVYISGAITGAPDKDINLFYEAEAHLRETGYSPFNPLRFDIPDAGSNEEKWTFALCRDIEIICREDCQGIAVLSTFERSKGALLEIFVATCLRVPVILLPGQSPTWPGKVVGIARAAQERLWLNVDGSRYPHHSDLPYALADKKV